MAYKLIKGEFHIFYPDQPRNGPQPDGDTLKFLPYRRYLVEGLQSPEGNRPAFNNRGMVNIRFEGIDALETHFSGMHQNLEWAEGARDTLLEWAGFGNVTFWDDAPNRVRSVENHPLPGYILTRGLDTYGRIVAFVYPGETDRIDGAEVFLDENFLDQSLNARLLKEGWVYPAFYSSLPVDLRNHMAVQARSTRESDVGLWSDATAGPDRPQRIADLDYLEDLVIWPKLFRRLACYFAAGFSGLDQFDPWLRADPVNRDDRVLLPTMELGNMHDLIEIRNEKIRMIHRPEDIVILPDGAVPLPTPGPVPIEIGGIRIIAALVNPAGPERGKERVTLLNITPARIALEGWCIVDRAGGEMPLGGAIDAGDVLQITLSPAVRLNNREDTISLLDPDENLISQVGYKPSEVGREGWTLVFSG